MGSVSQDTLMSRLKPYWSEPLCARCHKGGRETPRHPAGSKFSRTRHSMRQNQIESWQGTSMIFTPEMFSLDPCSQRAATIRCTATAVLTVHPKLNQWLQIPHPNNNEKNTTYPTNTADCVQCSTSIISIDPYILLRSRISATFWKENTWNLHS
jgi:hypothetical protein